MARQKSASVWDALEDTTAEAAQVLHNAVLEFDRGLG